ncbi:MAG: Dam family site-specific DNA-(adenine-N6)-methyltransferase [Floccifex sp.]
MEYMSAKEAAEKWGISQRRVAVLCSENRVENATMIGNMWIIPKNAEKPADARSLRYFDFSKMPVKPFLKWAGGKGQLIKEIEPYYPFEKYKEINKYAEPFVGGGAVLFDILNKYDLDEVYISDTNEELINTYLIVRNNVEDLIDFLSDYQNTYSNLVFEQRKDYYLKKRDRFNFLKINGDEHTNIEKASLMIFLNKTCFNGLYRVNRKGMFNVPMGNYKNPCICDSDNLLNVSDKLQKVNIVCGDYRKSIDFIDKNTFVYFDPPYRPLSETSSFTSYTEDLFDDENQIELANYVNDLDKMGAKIVVSNSDPKNTNEDDNFFDEIYSNQIIKRIMATRMINSKASSRGKINELLISNFEIL